ncbi:MAG: NERD domain-containing protein [Gammaproteobacteria bacterium]
MPVTLSEFLHKLINNSEWQATLLVAAVALAGLLYVISKRVLHWLAEYRIKKIIRRLGACRVKNLRLPDGTGGEVIIEYLVLAPQALVIVGVMRFDGLIFGARVTDQWTQVLGRRSYKFDNPEHYLQRKINAIKQILPDVPVRGWHLFANAKFPKDKPDSVLLLSDLKTLPPRPRHGDIPKPLRLAWNQVLEVAG